MALRFTLLGPVEATRNGTPLWFARPRHRALLALLLLQSGQTVPVERLIDDLWGEQPPATARAQVQNTASALRRALGPDGHLISTRGSGYAITATIEEVDVLRFERLVAEARTAADPAHAARLLREALALWRGTPMDGVPAPFADRARTRLEEQRLAATEHLYQAELDQGRHAELVAELTALVRQQPLRDTPLRQLMLALYRSGRRAEALAHYDHARRLLAHELGLDPSAEVQKLHLQILAASPDLAGEATEAHVAPRRGIDTLPAATPHFTGRVAELYPLQSVEDDRDRDSAMIHTIDGMGGVGKTTLAVQAAHRLADQFPDARIFLDLHGFTAGREPLTPAAALDTLLRTIGVAGANIPHDLDGRAAKWCAEMAGLRAVIVLDNAYSVGQVQPLLPGSPSCLVLVTSRRRLVGIDAWRTTSLDVLPESEAVALFARIIGVDRVVAEPEAVKEAVRRCGLLPLAVSLAAVRLRNRPQWAVADLVERLSESRRNTVLNPDPGGVTTAFNLSYDNVTEPQQRLFRLLGHHPGSTLDRYAAAALVERPLEEVERDLEELVDAHLLLQPAPGRYTFHDLVRDHARALVPSDESREASEAARLRLLSYYGHAASRAVTVLQPHRPRPRPLLTPSPAELPSFTDQSGAGAWLDLELSNLLACADQAAGRSPALVVELSTTLRYYLDDRGHYSRAAELHAQALRSARELADPAGQIHAHNSLGNVAWRLGNHDRATAHCEQALALARENEDRAGEAHATNTLAIIYRRLGRYEEAAKEHRLALRLARELGDRALEGRVLNNLGIVDRRLGQHALAADHFRDALAVARDVGDRAGEGYALNNLGIVYRRWGWYELAADHCGHALELAKADGDRAREAYALLHLGVVHRELGQHEPALEHLDRAMSLSRQLGDHASEGYARNEFGILYRRLGRHELAIYEHRQALRLATGIGERTLEAEVSNSLGEAVRAGGDPEQALRHHLQALTLATRLGDYYEIARAHHGLGDAHHELGQADEAHRCWKDALVRYAELGTPEADVVGAAAAFAPALPGPATSRRHLTTADQRERRRQPAAEHLRRVVPISGVDART